MILFRVRCTLISEMFYRHLYLLKAVVPGSMKCCSSSESSLSPWLHQDAIFPCGSHATVLCSSLYYVGANVIDSLSPKKCISIYHTLAGELDITTCHHAPHENVFYGLALAFLPSLLSMVYCKVT